MREYLIFASPAEFRSEYLTEERSLRRARGHLPLKKVDAAAAAR
jgi:hypothetical protein